MELSEHLWVKGRDKAALIELARTAVLAPSQSIISPSLNVITGPTGGNKMAHGAPVSLEKQAFVIGGPGATGLFADSSLKGLVLHHPMCVWSIFALDSPSVMSSHGCS